jgi:hypothetical protein
MVSVLAAWAMMVAGSALARQATEGLAAASEPSWKAVAASGPVQARVDGAGESAWRAVARGDELVPRTQVETGRRGRATLVRRASLLILDPESRVELPGDGYSEMESSVVQTQGSVLYQVDGRAHPHFEVVTPFLAACVKGTSFLVTVNSRYASVTVEHGAVEITNPATGSSVLLGPGDSVVRHREEAEMELVRDRRGSREARREARRLERMDRRETDPDGKAALAREDPSDPEPAGKPVLTAEDVAGAAGIGDPREFDGVKGGEKDSGRVEVEEISRELLEELIREEIQDGAIKAPADNPAEIGGN